MPGRSAAHPADTISSNQLTSDTTADTIMIPIGRATGTWFDTTRQIDNFTDVGSNTTHLLTNLHK